MFSGKARGEFYCYLSFNDRYEKVSVTASVPIIWKRQTPGHILEGFTPLTVHTLLLHSPAGLDLKFATKGLESPLKLVA